MKLQFIKAPLILILAITFSLAGCLKDNYFDSGQSQAFVGSKTQVISLGTNVQSPSNYSALAYDNTFNDTTVDFLPVELGGPNAAKTDIQVTIDTSQAVLDSLNNQGVGPGDLAFPDGITIVNPVVTIKAGSRIGYLQIKFTPHNYIGLDVAMGFVIKSVSPSGYVISGNLGTGALGIVIKNAYDGKYVLTEYMAGWSNYNIADNQTFTWPGSVVYASTGTGSNLIVTPQSGSGQTGFSPSGGILSFGAAVPQYNIDPTTNKLISIDNLQPDGRNRHFTVNPADDSHYDPATKTIYLSYFMDQNGRPQQTIKDTLVYVGPR